MFILRLSLSQQRALGILSGRIFFVGIKPVLLLLCSVSFSSESISTYTRFVSFLPVFVGFFSIPLYRDFYVSYRDGVNKKYHLSGYLTASTFIFSFGFWVAFLVEFILDKSLALSFSFAALFVIDKIIDEIMRYLEFRKEFFWWFFWGMVRNFWSLVFAIFLFSGFSVESSISFGALGGFLLSLLSLLSFFPTKKMVLYFNASAALKTTKSSGAFYLAGFYKILLRNSDKILVSTLAPSISAYIVTASMFIGASYLLVDAVLISSRRKLLSLKPRLFAKIAFPVLFRYFFFFTFILFGLSLLLAVLPASIISSKFVLWVSIMMLGSALVGLASVPTHEVYFWLSKKRQYFGLHFVNLALLGSCLLLAVSCSHSLSEDENIVLSIIIPYICSSLYLAALVYFIREKCQA